MTQEEFDNLVSKVNKEAATVVKQSAEKLEAQITTIIEKAENGKLSNAEQLAIKTIVTEAQDDMLETLKAQGESIQKMEAKLFSGNGAVELKSFVAEVNDSVKANEIGKGNKGSFKEFRVGVDKSGNLVMLDKDVNNKAVDTHRVENATVDNRTLTTTATLVDMLRGVNSGMVETSYRTTPWILDFVDTGNTDMATIMWWDEMPKEGDFAITAECDVKPQMLYKFEQKFSNKKKIAAWIKISEEFDQDFPGLVSTIKSLMQVDCKNKIAASVLTDMIAAATPYSNPVLVAQIDNADDWAAIAAAVGQVGNAYANTNLLITNNNRSIVTAASKGSDGHYLNFQSLKEEINAGGITHFKHPDVAFNSFIVGDGKAYKVRLYGDIIVKIGLVNDDLIKNQYCVVVEQFYHTYISTAKKVGLVTGDFAAVKALIEKP